MATFNCPDGSICTDKAGDLVGGRIIKDTRGRVRRDPSNPGTKIYYATATKVNKDPSGQVTGGTTDVYIIKDGEFVRAATTSDGGKTYTYTDAAGADFKKDLSNQNSNLNKNIDAQISKRIDKSDDPSISSAKSKLVDGTKNNAPTEPEGDPQGGTAPPGEDGKQGINIDDIKIEADQRTNYDNLLKYPETLNPQYQDYFKIMMVEYTPRGLKTDPQSLSLSSRSNLANSRNDSQVGDRKILSNIILPIPAGIGDSNTLDWQSDQMNMLELMGASILGGAIAGGEQGATDATSGAAEGIKANTGALQQAATSAIVKNVTGVNRLQRQQGAVFNNNMELLFNGPQLRSFNFTFRLSARSKSEARIIQKIIRTLKQGMSAKKANNFLFVKSPHTFFLGYYRNQELHPFLNKFKECALTGLNMSYTPDGNYATFYDGAITSYEMTMTFQELEPVFDSDYGSDYETIGY